VPWRRWPEMLNELSLAVRSMRWPVLHHADINMYQLPYPKCQGGAADLLSRLPHSRSTHGIPSALASPSDGDDAVEAYHAFMRRPYSRILRRIAW